MANLLTMADIQAVLKLHEQGWRQRRIARELHVEQNKRDSRINGAE